MQATQHATQDFDWTSVAQGWDRHSDRVESLKTELSAGLIAGLHLAPGERVLELGAGTGALALRLAAAVLPGGTVLASDSAAGMVELIQASSVGVAGIEVAQIDAAAIPLDDATFDVVVMRMGLMLLPDPAAALTEIHRVLAPGGRLAVAVWGGPQHNPWLTVVGMAAMMHGLVQGGPPTGPGSPFSLADPDVFARLLTDAGFADVRISPFDGYAPFASTDEHFDTVRFLAPPLAAALATASPEALAKVRATAAGLLEQYRTGAGLRIPVRSLLGLASR